MRLRPRVSPVSLALLGALLIAALSSVTASLTSRAAAAPTELIMSEYVEGSASNKALEIYNGTGTAVTLTGAYDVQIFANGSPTATATIPLTGTLADGDVFVLARSAAVAAILAQADQTTTNFLWNGNDVLALRHSGTIVDVIGQVGVDPGAAWGSGTTSTLDQTLRRKAQIQSGDTNGADPFDPAGQWDGFPIDSFDGLGTHSTTGGGGGGGGGTQAPSCAPVSLSTSEDEELDAAPLCSDPDGDTLTLEIVTQGSKGVASIVAGALHYVPGADEHGSDSFTYRAGDGTNLSLPATATVTILAVNDDPDVEDDAASTNEDEPLSLDVLANDDDPDGDPLLISGVADGEHGSVTVAPDGKSLIYGPDPDANGADSFEYTVTDGAGGEETAEVAVTVVPINDPPRALDDAVSVAADSSIVLDVRSNDSPGPGDESGQALAVQSVGSPSHGVATLVDTGPDAGQVRYTPSVGYRGADSFAYVVSDGAATATATVRVTVTAAPPKTICGLPATILGTPGSDVIEGTPGDDVIRARRGNDTIDGRGGNDVVCGGPGADRIVTGSGNDLIAGGTGGDTVDAGDGRNRVRGGNGADDLTTGAGNDAIVAGGGNDAIVAGGGSNTVAAGAGDDQVRSGPGPDRIDGGPGTDTCDAGGGGDRVLRCE